MVANNFRTVLPYFEGVVRGVSRGTYRQVPPFPRRLKILPTTKWRDEKHKRGSLSFVGAHPCPSANSVSDPR